jgi:salicylate 5-hydroxylase large subunit
MKNEKRDWADDDYVSVPYWVYTDPEVYQNELERIWYGDHWLYCGLEVEVPDIGSFRTMTLGERPVIMIRSSATEISVVENRCGHRGTKVVWTRSGKALDLTCPYHQWSFDLKGCLLGVPLRRGVKGEGGMPKDFKASDRNLRQLNVEVVNGVVWASFSVRTPSFRDYLGPKMWRHYERIFSGRKLRVVGYSRQRINGNWKLMLENNKDAYHGALLHAFFATFGLFRPDQKSAMEMDDTGRHACITSVMAQGGANAIAAALPGFNSALKLEDPRLVQAVRELDGEETMGASTVFPSVVLLQQVNSLHTRQIVPRDVGSFDFIWTYFGFDDDDQEMRNRRIRHANLFGPAGFVSADDAEVIRMAQQGFEHASQEGFALNLMGGREIATATNMASETTIRGMYRYYRQLMDL